MMEAAGDVDGLMQLTHFIIRHQGTVGIIPELHKWLFWFNDLFGSTSASMVETMSKEQIQKHRGSLEEKEDTAADPFVTKLLKLEAVGKVQAVHMLDSMASNIAAG